MNKFTGVNVQGLQGFCLLLIFYFVNNYLAFCYLNV